MWLPTQASVATGRSGGRRVQFRQLSITRGSSPEAGGASGPSPTSRATWGVLALLSGPRVPRQQEHGEPQTFQSCLVFLVAPRPVSILELVPICECEPDNYSRRKRSAARGRRRPTRNAPRNGTPEAPALLPVAHPAPPIRLRCSVSGDAGTRPTCSRESTALQNPFLVTLGCLTRQRALARATCVCVERGPAASVLVCSSLK